jgi:NDMA-dependent alcohol dehydrogenase
MKVSAALLREVPGKWEVQDVELDSPREGEVLVQVAATGMCHSDDHFATGDITVGHLPLCGGHEASGVVQEVGPGVRTLEPGDHIVTSFVPSCGRCRWCAGGQQNLCDNGALMLEGHQLDGSYRMHLDGEPVAQAGMISGFADYSVMPELSCIRIDDDIPLELASLLGCAVPTGWGSAVNAANVRPGDIVVVMGAGGIGIAAVQGAAHAGASRVVVVEPVAAKHELCTEFGATDVFASIEEATDLARGLTNGQGADSAIICVGVLTSDHVRDAFASIRKAGTVVVTAAASDTTSTLELGPLELTMYQKRIQGSIYGMMSPAKDVPRLVEMWRSGALKLSEMVSNTYALDQINQGYADMHAGLNIRGLVVPGSRGG